MKTEHLLSSEFIEFSQKIAEIYRQKEEKSKEMKELYIKHRAEIADLEAQAGRLKEEFDAKIQ